MWLRNSDYKKASIEIKGGYRKDSKEESGPDHFGMEGGPDPEVRLTGVG